MWSPCRRARSVASLHFVVLRHSSNARETDDRSAARGLASAPADDHYGAFSLPRCEGHDGKGSGTYMCSRSHTRKFKLAAVRPVNVETIKPCRRALPFFGVCYSPRSGGSARKAQCRSRRQAPLLDTSQRSTTSIGHQRAGDLPDRTRVSRVRPRSCDERRFAQHCKQRLDRSCRSSTQRSQS